jgi:hypothetical protein
LVQAAVVGLSTRVDVMEMLEKRVRSRFSYRRHFVPGCEEALLSTTSRNSAPAILEVFHETNMLYLCSGVMREKFEE